MLPLSCLVAMLIVPPAVLWACGRTNLFPEDRGGIADAGPTNDAEPSGDGPIPDDDSAVDACPYAPEYLDAMGCTDADIRASSYNQTCVTDTDCFLIGEGENCLPCSTVCGPYGAINVAARIQFWADLAKTPGGQDQLSGLVSCTPCCGPSYVACCQAGTCVAALRCGGAPSK